MVTMAQIDAAREKANLALANLRTEQDGGTPFRKRQAGDAHSDACAAVDVLLRQWWMQDCREPARTGAGAIDPEKIKEWRSDVAENRSRTGDDGDEFLDQSDAVAALLAEREKMLAVLHEVEWKGFTMDTDRDVCPCCARAREEGHTPNCRLAALLKGANTT
jgi:hypothetical protein